MFSTALVCFLGCLGDTGLIVQQRSDDVKIRLAYGGRLYAEFETLEAHPHWDYANEYVVNALVLG